MRPEIPLRQQIKCPLCGQLQPMILYGTVKDFADQTKLRMCFDMGYSFCNCYNIFFTDKKNLDNTIYGDSYTENYGGLDSFYKPYLKFIDEVDGGNFAEVGPVNDVILDGAIAKGYTRSFCFDIAKRKTKHYQYIGDFEKVKADDLLQKFNFIFMAHVFEHFVNPFDTIREIGRMLRDDGKLFILMPDPAQINWSDPYQWAHLHAREHHILWDMDSFIQFTEEHSGLKCIFKERNFWDSTITTGDYRIMFQKKMI